VEGDYRFDSILPMDLDRENFPPIPVDTVLMEAARIMDEWPEVQRRLPDTRLPLAKTAAGKILQLDLDQDLSSVLDGGAMQPKSGLSHEQETTLTYFNEPSSIQNVLQVSRYDELDTYKMIADLLEMGLLEVSPEAQEKRTPLWNLPREQDREAAAPRGPSRLFWLMVGVLLAGPLIAYVPHGRASFNQGLASLQRPDVPVVSDPCTRDRQAWAFRMAAPGDGGAALAQSLGVRLEDGRKYIPDFTLLADPLGDLKP